jgi:hypothetical protein
MTAPRAPQPSQLCTKRNKCVHQVPYRQRSALLISNQPTDRSPCPVPVPHADSIVELVPLTVGLTYSIPFGASDCATGNISWCCSNICLGTWGLCFPGYR